MIKSAFYFKLKAIFVLKKFDFVFVFNQVRKWLDQKVKINFKLYDVTN